MSHNGHVTKAAKVARVKTHIPNAFFILSWGYKWHVITSDHKHLWFDIKNNQVTEEPEAMHYDLCQRLLLEGEQG